LLRNPFKISRQKITKHRIWDETAKDGLVVMNKKVEWGVLGVADIAVKRVIPAMQHGEM
jgi:hypothetical protein